MGKWRDTASVRMGTDGNIYWCVEGKFVTGQVIVVGVFLLTMTLWSYLESVKSEILWVLLLLLQLLF